MPYLKVTLAVSTARSGTLRTPLGQITDKDIRRQVFYLSTFKERMFFFSLYLKCPGFIISSLIPLE